MTPPWTVAMYFALLVVVMLGVGILIFGKASVAVRGPGIVRPEGGAITLVAPRSGYVDTVRVLEGTDVASATELAVLIDSALLSQLQRQRDKVAQLQAAMNAKTEPAPGETKESLQERLADAQSELATLRTQADHLRLRSPIKATVAHVHVHAGEYVAEGAPLLTLLPGERPLVGYLAMREKDRPKLRPGASVRLRLDAYPAQDVGFATGTIRSVGKDLLSESWEKRFASMQGSPLPPSVLVEVSLDSMPPQAQGRFENGMVFTGEVVVGEQRIASLLL